MNETSANIIEPIPNVQDFKTESEAQPYKNNWPWKLVGLVIFIVLIALLSLIIIGNQKRVEKNPAVINEPKVISEAPVAIDNPELIEFVRGYLKMGAETQFAIEKVEGDYAYGTGGAENASGFYWAAAKKDGQWNYAFAGNGIPSCSEVEVFPVGTFFREKFGGKFDECYNDKNELIDRKTGLPIK